MALATATLVEVANDDMKLYSSVRDSVEETNLTRSMESSIPESQNSVCIITRKIKYAAYRDRKKVVLLCFHQDQVSKMPWSVYVRVKPMLVCSTKRQILVDDTCNDPEEIVLADSVPNTKGTILEVVAKNFFHKNSALFPPISIGQVLQSGLKANLSLHAVPPTLI
ncbi:unnamed protein product [Hymenolepis diminuta]|uniref:START domain-containing protein n=1 Tax=Hymenolepis diminuta TaxID=6216 RepID=A0A158QC45_HYMDI|nr:unnamed protein product [Hymenolepis diminuta]